MMPSILETNVVIIGAGPVGLYLAIRLSIDGFTVTVLERKTEIDQHSKSLGIHPVSLELFDALGIAVRFTNAGIPIRNGHAFLDKKKIGTVSFDSCPKPFNYILALPQYRTEQLLEECCRSMDNISIRRGASLKTFSEKGDHVNVTYTTSGETHEISCKYLMGCDGKESTVRKTAGIAVQSKTYPDTYIMGDFTDNTEFGADAAVYLHRDGLIESFPLPNSYRRWVVKTDRYIENPDRNVLENIVLRRLDHRLSDEKNVMMSSFGVQHQLAESLNSGRILLAGDSAHVVSPIGGQGMNLGWITASNLGDSLLAIRKTTNRENPILDSFSKTSRSIAKTVAKRAEINMWLGRKRALPLLRNSIARLIVNTPLQRKMARLFTMRDL